MTQPHTLHLPPRHVLERIAAIALEEDLGRGDVTTEATVPNSVQGAATFTARHPLVLSGVAMIVEVYRQVDPSVVVSAQRADGDRLGKGEHACRVSGSAASILRGERVALNFAQRMSGVATLSRRYVDALPSGSRTRITDTRKTTPGLRALERYAVRTAARYNHRDDLGSAVLIKDNHIAAAAASARPSSARARTHRTPAASSARWTTLAELDEALAAGADIIMLDNFDDETTRSALGIAKGRPDRGVGRHHARAHPRTLGELGVDVISVGALTHSAPAVDLGLDWAAP
jgi:nicotinate-nucleotide pyrophosphorylase (carboxylating)